MKIGDLCTYAPKSSIKAGEAISNGEYMFFTSSADENKRYSNYQLDCEAIIMGTGGNATLHYYNGKFSTSTDCVVLIPNKHIRCKYLYYFFLCNMVTLENGFKGVGLKHTNKNYISNIEIYNVPNIETQDKIIKVLDMAFGIKFYYQQQLQKLDELVKSRFIEMFGDPKNNPNGYLKKRLKDTCRVITGNTPSRAVSEYYGNSIEWIKTDNIIEGMLHPTVATESLSEKGLDVGRTVESDSILMACIAGSLSSIGRVCVTDRKVAFNQQINAIEPNDYNALFLYVMLQLSKEYLIEEINMALKGILSKSKLEGKVFIVPPMDLQQRFAAFVEQVDKSKLAIQQSLEKLETLKKALMQQYFR